MAILVALANPALSQTELTCVGEVANGYHDFKPKYEVHEKGREIKFSYRCDGSWPQTCKIQVGGKRTTAERYLNSSDELVIGLAQDLDVLFYVDSRKIQIKMKYGSAEEQRWFSGICSM